MKHLFSSLVLTLLTTFGCGMVSSYALAGEPADPRNPPILFVLDLDQIFVPVYLAEDKIPPGFDLQNISGQMYRVDPFAAEFIMAVRHYLPRKLNIKGRLAVVSHSPVAKAKGLIENLKLTQNGRFKSLFEEVKIVSHGPLLFQDALRNDFLPEQVVFLGDKIPGLSPPQKLQALQLAEANRLESQLFHEPKGALSLLPAEEERHPIQMSRHRYRLARALGLLEMAVDLYTEKSFRSIGEALSSLQWTSDGQFRDLFVNKKAVFQGGMAALEITHFLYLMPQLPMIKRTGSDFQFVRFVPKASECESYFGLHSGYLPWESYR